MGSLVHPDILRQTVAQPFAPGVVRQEEQPLAEALFNVYLQGVVSEFAAAQDRVEVVLGEGLAGRIASEEHRKARGVGIQVPAFPLQFGSPGARVGDRGQNIPRQFLLYVQVPLLDKALVEFGIHDHKIAEEGGQIRRGLGREAVVQVEGRTVETHRIDLRGGGVRIGNSIGGRKEGRREGRVHVHTLHAAICGHVREDRVSAAKDGGCFPERTPRETDSRFKVVCIGADSGVAIGIDASHKKRIRKRNVVGKAVVVFSLGRSQVVSEAEIQGEVGGYPPSVLKVCAILFPAASV